MIVITLHTFFTMARGRGRGRGRGKKIRKQTKMLKEQNDFLKSKNKKKIKTITAVVPVSLIYISKK